ncbi:telomere repeats-binding bouquet formation protein 2 isoform X1 [Xenopus tropicalis]|uniref:Telomere repeats-binding bouquet formation protein 2 isoform X1 n=1 Tax=Xenopus tropicalis TaxID=8364 RepID=A0A8J1JDC2_XENTR|nr:telomere repeats-binding bouquet formation protein 2 isoform X1 [Xenopus tropicalis]
MQISVLSHLNMYAGRKAWFSNSVQQDICSLWEAEGGVITNHYHAEYLFSSDASHPDTQRIYKSKDYVESKATVFHTSFLQSNAQSKNMASLGHFILPPFCLQEEIRRKIGNFFWEQENGPSVQQDICNNEEPTCINTENQQRNAQTDNGKQIHYSDTTEDTTEEVTFYTLQNYPVNNMLTDYISIEEMKKFSWDLHDFTPNTADYSAFCVQDEHKKNILSKK